MIDHDPHFFARLHDEGPGYAVEGTHQPFHLPEAADILFKRFPERARPGHGEGVGGSDHYGQGADFFQVVVDGVDAPQHFGRFSVLLRDRSPQLPVRAFRTAFHGLADVVEQSAAPGQGHVQIQFLRHDSRQLGHFATVMQRVLPAGHAVLQMPKLHGQFGTDAGNAQVEEHLVARILDQIADFILGFGDDLLDESRMDPPVLDQLLHGELRDFAAHGVEPGEDDGIGGVVDDDVDPR